MTSYLFGYGSLMNATSAGRLLGRRLSPAELVPAWLDGYLRTWSLKELVFSEALQRSVTAAFLDLTPDAGTACNGVLLEVSAAEMERARNREKNYDAVDVTSRIRGDDDSDIDGKVITFVARPEFRTHGEEDDVWVMKRYVEMIDRACAALGGDFRRAFAASTRTHAYDVLDGRYTFVDPAQAKLV